MKLLRYTDLVARGIVSNRKTLARWIKEQDFPQPVRLGPNTIAWSLPDVEAWLDGRTLTRNAAA